MIRAHRKFVASVGILLALGGYHTQVSAQATNITPSGLNTDISTSGTITLIDGGTRPGGGPNLFHSFGQFSVGTGDTALFRNTDGGVTNNIFGRVTGGNVSSIFGTIDTATNFPQANLWLINPAGFLFGPTAVLNVGGSVNMSTADYLKMTDGKQFFADPAKASVLSMEPVVAFGFMGTNPGGTITVQGGTVNNAIVLTLVGRDMVDGSGTTTAPGILVHGGAFTNPGGTIRLGSVGAPLDTRIDVSSVGGELLTADLSPASAASGHGFANLGSIQMTGGAKLDVSADTGGLVILRGRELVMESNTKIAADTINGHGGGIAIGVQDVALTKATLSTNTSGRGNGGNLTFNVDTLTMRDGSVMSSRSDSNQVGAGNAGAITIQGTGGSGTSATSVTLDNAIVTNTVVTGSGTPIRITAKNLTLNNRTDISTVTQGTGHAGDIILNVETLQATGESGGNKVTLRSGSQGSSTSPTGFVGDGDAGAITIRGLAGDTSAASTVTLGQTLLTNTVVGGLGNTIRIHAETLTMENGTVVTAGTVGSGRAGDILFKVDTMKVSGVDTDVVSGSFGCPTCTGPEGDAGAITIAGSTHSAASTVIVSDGAFVSNKVRDGNGNPILVTADTIQLLRGAVLETRTTGLGDAGAITLNADRLTINGGAQVISNSSSPQAGAGNAGAITMQGVAGDGTPATSVTLDNATVTNAVVTGGGKPISITAKDLTLRNRTDIAGVTQGTGHAGDITLSVERFQATGGSVGNRPMLRSGSQGNSSSPTGFIGNGDAGAITIRGLAGDNSAAKSVTLDRMLMTNTVVGGLGNTIRIHAETLTMENGTVVTAGTVGSGRAGDILFNVDTMKVSGVDTDVVSGSFGCPTCTGPEGDAGAITIAGSTNSAASSVTVSDGAFVSNRVKNGNGNPILVTADTIQLLKGAVLETRTTGQGHAGTITFNANRVIMSGGAQVTSSSISNQVGAGNAGAITMQGIAGAGTPATSVMLDNAIVTNAVVTGGGKPISITAKNLTLRNRADIAGVTQGIGHAGDITLSVETFQATGAATGNKATLRSGSQGNSSSPTGFIGDGDAGAITIRGLAGDNSAAKSVALDRTVITNTVVGGLGNTIRIHAETLTMEHGTVVTTGTVGSGRAGDIAVKVDTMKVADSDVFSGGVADGGAGALTIEGWTHRAAERVTVSDGASLSNEVANGDGKALTVTAGTITVQSGGKIRAQTTGRGHAGTITLNADTINLLSGAKMTARTSGRGNGGNITLNAGQLLIQNGVDISTSSASTDLAAGRAGNIALVSATDLTLKNSTITTSAVQASGGNIKLTAANTIYITDSTISSSVKGLKGSNGGNISIDPIVVAIRNSLISATANAGAGGNIDVSASGAVLVDPNTTLDASAGPAGVSGSVNINAPIQVLGGTLVPLKVAYSQAGLSGDRCAADPQGRFSSFVQTGHEGVPQLPGSFSPSPLAQLDQLLSSSLGSELSPFATARLGVMHLGLERAPLLRFHSACRS